MLISTSFNDTRPQLLQLGSSPRSPAVFTSILLGHGLALWAFLQIDNLHDVVVEVAPMMVRIIATPAQKLAPSVTATQPPVVPVVLRAAPPPPQMALPEINIPIEAAPQAITAVPVAQPTPQPPAAPAPPAVVKASPPAPPAPVTAPSLPSPAAAVSAAPANLPASAVQYLVPPAPLYPRASRRRGETGRVRVRVLVSETGLPERVQLEHSSGFELLDEAALAAVRKTRFKPYTENGSPRSGWAVIPLSFDLER